MTNDQMERAMDIEKYKDELHRANRLIVDRDYMIQAIIQMLGPKGREVWEMWQKKGVQRIHTSWGPGAAQLSGEEIAEVHLRNEEAINRSITVDIIDKLV